MGYFCLKGGHKGRYFYLERIYLGLLIKKMRGNIVLIKKSCVFNGKKNKKPIFVKKMALKKITPKALILGSGGRGKTPPLGLYKKISLAWINRAYESNKKNF